MSKIQIVMPVINLWDEYTKDCIVSIMHNFKAGNSYRILAIDNASNTYTRDELSKLVSDIVAHKRNEERWGCQKSWNYGINDAWERGFDYVLVINNDILLHSDAISRLVERFEKAKEHIIDLPDGDSVKESWSLGMVTCMDIKGELPNPKDLFNKNSVDYEAVAESENPNFSAFMINKLCWEKVGEFDEGFAPAYFEDNDYHYRMKLAGLKAITYPPALFYHYGSRTTNEALGGNKKTITGEQFEKNKLYYKSKWGDAPGKETFTHPFNDELKDYKWTK